MHEEENSNDRSVVKRVSQHQMETKRVCVCWLEDLLG